MKRFWGVFFTFLFFPLAVYANEWQVDYQKSTITFSAIQNKSPTKGSFPRFTSQIFFTPKAIQDSRISTIIDMTQIEADYQEVANTLHGEAWFDTAQYPTAEFSMARISHKKDNDYTMEGMLTLKGISQEILLPFTLEIFPDGRAVAIAEFTLDRRDFNIGQGSWKATDVIAAEVTVIITIHATITPTN